MPASYDSLLADLLVAINRNTDTDEELARAIPGIFERAERRIARDLNLSVFGKVAEGTMAIGNNTIDRAGNMVSGITVEITLAGGQTKQLEWRSLAFIRGWWDFPDNFGEPRYVALKSDDKLEVAPPPDSEYPWAFFYRKHAEYLGPSRQTNVLSRDYPDLLHAALCYQAAMFAIEDRRDAIRETYAAEYERLKTGVASAEAGSGMGQYQAGEHIDQIGKGPPA